MAVSPERESKSTQAVPQEVEDVKESVEIPEYVEKSGVSATPTTPSAVADDTTDDSGGKTTTDDSGSLVVPQDPKLLEEEAKGDPENALTWFAYFWLRMIKKALHAGKKIVGMIPSENVDKGSVDNGGQSASQITNQGISKTEDEGIAANPSDSESEKEGEEKGTSVQDVMK